MLAKALATKLAKQEWLIALEAIEALGSSILGGVSISGRLSRRSGNESQFFM
jgi:hypothetical protein